MADGSSPDSEGRLQGYEMLQAGASSGGVVSQGSVDGCIREQDRLLPIANVGRIMKQILPPNAKISKEAKETMQECASEFISFVTGEASDKCHKEKRKTVNGDDICWAMETLGFDDYAQPIKRYLQKYREYEAERAATAAAAAAAGGGGGGAEGHGKIGGRSGMGDVHGIFGGEYYQFRDLQPSSPNPTLRFDVMDGSNASSSRKL